MPPRHLRGDETALFARHNPRLVNTVAGLVRADRTTIEDACQNAWAILLRRQPDRATVFGWLVTTAVHEAWRLDGRDRRDHPPFAVDPDGPEALVDSTSEPPRAELCLEAKEALGFLAALPERQRTAGALQAAGFSYEEIAEITGRSVRAIDRHLRKLAHARAEREHGDEHALTAA